MVKMVSLTHQPSCPQTLPASPPGVTLVTWRREFLGRLGLESCTCIPSLEWGPPGSNPPPPPLALCPHSHSTPSSPAAWPGFYLSSPELITVSFVPI